MTGVTVLGSLNVDEIATVSRLPEPGETVLATGLMRRPGGKGANQAVAAARAGARVRMVGATGDDTGDALLRTALSADDVDTGALRHVADQPTGLAVVTVQDDGENTITVVPGANAALGDDDVAAACERLATGDTLLLQLEVPLPVVAEAARAASAAGARVVLNAAPARPVDDVLADVDVLVVNEHECLVLAGAQADPTAAGATLAQAHGLLVVVTLGAGGAAWTTGAAPVVHPAPQVRAVDTTGAGDTFTGYLVAALDRGLDTDAALRLAVAAASIAVTRPGAQDGIPYAADVLASPG